MLLAAGAALPQKPGAVEGTVTNITTGAPVRKALVTLRDPNENAGFQAVTDAAGHFRISNVKPGSYGLWAEAQGFVRDLARIEAPSQIVKVAEDKTIEDFAIRLEPLGAISGRVLDNNGDPVAGATVTPVDYTYSHAGPSLRQAVPSTTNERGEYRVFDLTPGHWYLKVYKAAQYAAATGRVHRAVPEAEYGYTFYPGVAREEEAGVIEVAAGADVGQIDVRIRKMPAYHARGKVIDGPSGQPAAKARVEIEAWGYVETRADGTFDVRSLTRGSYRMMAQIKGDPRFVSAAREVALDDHDVDGVVFRLEPAAMLQGTIVAEGPAAPKLPGTRAFLEPIGGFGEEDRFDIAGDGKFSVANLIPQTYRLMVDHRREGLYLKSLHLGAHDVTSEGHIEVAAGAGPLALTFASDAGSVEGSVQSAGPGTVWIEVTLAPAGALEQRMDLIETVYAQQDGSFRFKCVAPGEYKVFAWELADDSLAEYPGFRKILESKAGSVTVHAAEKQTVGLKVITAAEIQEARRQLR
jgi:hypothetical protein